MTSSKSRWGSCYSRSLTRSGFSRRPRRLRARLSVRANNCLESAKIATVRDLVKKTDSDLLKVRSFGKTSLREVKRKLADLGLSLGMDLDAATAPMAAATMLDDDEEE